MANGSNMIPQRLINAKIYDESGKALGVATVKLPEIQAMTDTVSGAGISGEVEEPIIGHYQNMDLELTWSTILAEALNLSKPQAHSLDIRGSQQVYDSAMGKYQTVPVRISVKASPKTLALGDLEPGKATNTTQGFTVSYVKVFVDGKELLEIDKYNFIAKFNGEDILERVRKDLGMS